MVKLSHVKGQERIVFCDLIQNGPSTANQIVKRTRLKKNRVYEFLSDLRKEKVVLSLPMIHGETLYTFSRDEVLKCLRGENSKLNGLIAELNRIEEKVVNSQEKAIIQLSEEMWTGLPEQAELQTARFVQEAKQSILISTYMFKWFNKIEDALLSRAKRKEVVVRVLMTDPSSPRMFSSEHRRNVQSRTLCLREAGVEVNFTTERVPFRGSIFDGKVALIMMFPYSNEKEANACTGFCVCANSAIVHTLMDFFNTSIQQANRNTKN